MNILIKSILFVFAQLYGVIIKIRYWLYKHHFIGSTSFDVPVICIGNLSWGGTGKTPMIEYLIQLLQEQYHIGIISRGYKRNTTGFVLANLHHSYNDIGDEPLLLKYKYPNVAIGVGEERIVAIPNLIAMRPQTNLIIMDDGFQHLSVRPQVNILLTTYQNPFWEDHLIPLGTLREYPRAKSRANIIIVTKCPKHINKTEQQELIRQIQPSKNQSVFFSTIQYQPIYHLLNAEKNDTIQQNIVLITGIANAEPLVEHLSKQFNITHLEYQDHHAFSLNELERIKQTYPNQQWITTEKDAVRLLAHKDWLIENNIDLFIQPIAVEILHNQDDFKQLLIDYLEFFYGRNAS
ncbi:MAG: tetraacyldisaccharide 4'-kinase [Chitinophagales bacterium]|nr:tetraacyldisaccharide 4'-kinase [Chitinophagales bacterium]